MRIARKGGGGQEPAEEDGAEEEVAVEPSRRKQKTVTITTIQPHLNMSVLTHPQHQYRQSAAEEADPVGNVTRQSTGMMRAITYDAPDAKDVLSWMAKINEWPKLHIILAMVNIFCALVFARRAERKAKHAFLYLDADAYAVLQAFFLKIKAKMDAISGACMSGINCSLQSSAYSKAKGIALKLSGGIYMNTLMWKLCVENSELISFDGTREELEEVVT